jgi:8-amino-7-oxononanoate synthase
MRTFGAVTGISLDTVDSSMPAINLPKRLAVQWKARADRAPTLDFTSSLYLGAENSWQSLTGWESLTLGKPAALESVPGTRRVERELAALTGCERVLLGPSTLHLFWDLFGFLARRGMSIFLDAGSYPIAQWGVERAASYGAPVRVFPQHDHRALGSLLKNAPGKPVVVADGYNPLRGSSAPVAAYLECAKRMGGLVVLDDTQALGIFGHSQSKEQPYGNEGGGSLRRAGVRDDQVVLVSSLAKGFGAPLAMLGGSEAVTAAFEFESETRMHCSPPSAAVVAAAGHALAVNRRYGEVLRKQLAQRVAHFRLRLRDLNVIATGGLFPVQPLRLPEDIDVGGLHEALLAGGLQTVLHQSTNGADWRISFIITTKHSAGDIDWAVASLANAMVRGAPRRTSRLKRF